MFDAMHDPSEPCCPAVGIRLELRGLRGSQQLTSEEHMVSEKQIIFTAHNHNYLVSLSFQL